LIVPRLCDPGWPLTVTKALPSGTGERDLAALIKDIVAVQALAQPSQQESAWLAYLERARVDEGRKAALRSLLQLGTDWNRLGPALDRFLANPASSEAIRAFAFGIVVFGLTGGRWAQSQGAVAAFLCRQFMSEGRTGLVLQYLLNLNLVLKYTMEEAHRAAREPLRSPELAQQYQQIRAMYPGLLLRRFFRARVPTACPRRHRRPGTRDCCRRSGWAPQGGSVTRRR
jgi:hypothetical protein